MNIEISMDYILWMLENPEKLSDDEKLWVDTFVEMMNNEISKYKDTIDENCRPKRTEDHK